MLQQNEWMVEKRGIQDDILTDSPGSINCTCLRKITIFDSCIHSLAMWLSVLLFRVGDAILHIVVVFFLLR